MCFWLCCWYIEVRCKQCIVLSYSWLLVVHRNLLYDQELTIFSVKIRLRDWLFLTFYRKNLGGGYIEEPLCQLPYCSSHKVLHSVFSLVTNEVVAKNVCRSSHMKFELTGDIFSLTIFCDLRVLHRFGTEKLSYQHINNYSYIPYPCPK